MAPEQPHQLSPLFHRLGFTRFAPWPWGRALRSAIGIAGPLAIGFAVGSYLAAVWVVMGTLVAAAGEADEPYRARIRALLIAAPIAAAGYFTGYLTGLPYPLLIAAMAVIGFGGGLLSGFSTGLSVAAMQFLLVAALAIGLPREAIAPYWHPALLYLSGVFLHTIMIGIEAVTDRARPERNAIANLLQALATLAEATASAQPARSSQPARAAAISQLHALRAMGTNVRLAGSGATTNAIEAIAAAADEVLFDLLATSDGPKLQHAAASLAAMGKAISQRTSVTAALGQPAANAGGLERLAEAISAWLSLQSGGTPIKTDHEASGSLKKRVLGRSNILNALALGLCVGISYAAKYLNDASHWFWIPLTVALVMKPDFGSVFSRAAQRTAGTVIGVLIGIAVLRLFPIGMPLMLGIAALALLLPWAKSTSYAIKAVVMTPLILILVDLIQPAAGAENYAWQRLTDTIIGGAIVIIFGYLIWPHRRDREIQASFAACLSALADFLLATSQSDHVRFEQAGNIAYNRLASLRATLDQYAIEPAPTSHQAEIWLSTVATAERLCDRIAAHGATTAGDSGPLSASAEALRNLTEAVPALPATGNPFLDAVNEDIRRLVATLEMVSPKPESPLQPKPA